MADLFNSAPSADTKAAGPRPLADRLRPQSLSEVIGQRHILGPDGSLRVMLDAGSLGSLIFWGPPGVGKTTTTAKLAARCVVKYGADSLGLITTDSYRIGAQDQLRIYGKILGVQVYTAQNEADL